MYKLFLRGALGNLMRILTLTILLLLSSCVFASDNPSPDHISILASLRLNTNNSTLLQHNGYEIKYPKAWKAHIGDDGVVFFAYEIPDTKIIIKVNIQTIFTKAGGGKYKDVKDLMDDFLIQAPRHSQHAKLFNRKPIEFTGADGAKLSGEQITLTFEENKQEYKQWQIMMISQDGKVFQAFAYRAPIKYFDEYLPGVTAMLDSWVIQS